MQSHLKGAGVAGRNDGEVVNATLVRRPASSALTLVESSSGCQCCIDMLLQRHVDYLILFAADLDEPNVAPRVRASRPPLILPIAGVDTMVRAGVVCSRTPWGLMAMRRLGAVLPTPASTAALCKARDALLVPADRKRYAAEAQAVFMERARPTPVAR